MIEDREQPKMQEDSPLGLPVVDQRIVRNLRPAELKAIHRKKSKFGRRVGLFTQYNPIVAEYLRVLPDARWLKTENCWNFPATPLTVDHIADLYDGTGIELVMDSFAHETWMKLANLTAAHEARASDWSTLPQPVVRKGDSRRHQLAMYHFLKNSYGAMTAAWMGTGKSKVIVDLTCNVKPQWTLIACPLSVLGVWRREFGKWAGCPVDVLIYPMLARTAKGRLEALQSFREADRPRPAVVVANYDQLRVESTLEAMLKIDWGMVVCDESHKLKGGGATCDTMVRLAANAERSYLLTGTPMPHSPLDLFHQMKIIEPGLFGTGYQRHKMRYSIPDTLFPGKINEWLRQDELAREFAKYAIEIKSDVLDLPPITHQRISVALSAESAKIYGDLEAENVAEIKAGTVTVSNALVRALRLQQIACGHVGDSDLDIVERVNTSKRDALLEILDNIEAHEKVAICCRFKFDLDEIKWCAEQLGRRYGEVSGRQKDLTKEATFPDDIDIMGVQIQSGGVGVDLTAARYSIIYSTNWSLGDYDQYLSRVHRPGQSRPVTIYHLACEGTIEDQIYRSLRSKRDVIEDLMDYFRRGCAIAEYGVED